MQKVNFKSVSGKEYRIPEYRTRYKNGEAVHVDRAGRQLVDDAGVPLIEVPQGIDWENGESPSIGCGTDDAGKAKMRSFIKKRNDLHDKKEAPHTASRKSIENRVFKRMNNGTK